MDNASTLGPTHHTEEPNSESAIDDGAAGSWRPIGTVVGNAGTSEFTFILERFRATVGDIVAVPLEIPGPDSARREIIVWARITDITRFNPFFPYEAAHELANESLDLLDTVLSNSRDQLEAHTLILGATGRLDFSALFPLSYPIQPASRVYRPPSLAIKELLVGGRPHDMELEVGTLLARPDVDVGISAGRLVARHLAILAMTGGGKTVAARRIIRALAGIHYPMVILDPHGDYIGLWRCKELLGGADVKLFFPELTITEDGEDLIFRLIEQMTQGLSEPQKDLLGQVVARNKATAGTCALDYCNKLKAELINLQVNGRQEATKWAIVRS